MDDLLKEAIADAKAVRETALENAKMALEEAFTPRLQNMLSKKIQTELEDEDEKDMEERDMMDADEDPSDDDEDMEERDMMDDDDEDKGDEHSEGVNEEDIIEIDGVKYAPVVSEEEDEEEDDVEEAEEEEDDDMEEDLDLEAVIKELESELDEAEEVEEGKEEVEEQSKSSGIGAGDNKVAQPSAGDEEDPGKGKLKEGEEKEVDEDVDLDEVLAALSEEEDEDEKKDEVAELKSDLDEHRSVIETLRGKLNEVNLLNAKLLFTNKLFRKYGLNNEQKMKVVEQFDRAANLREVKLVYSTLGESFGSARNEINESKGSASKPVASTKPEKEVITESSDLRDRFKKLANLI
jgi:hypothetical protein